MTIAEIVAICVSIIGGFSSCVAIIYAFKNGKKSDTKDIEQRVADSTKLNMKLDEIGRNVNDIKYDITATKKEVQELAKKIVSIESSDKSAHHRIDGLEQRVNNLEN